MLTYSFDNLQHETLYQRLYQLMREDIVSGRLQANTHLPSKRSFARQLGISTITVENAYAQLVAEGYIYALPRRGYYVSDLGHMEDGGPIWGTAPLAAKGQSDGADAADAADTAPDPSLWLDFGSNQNEPGSFPFSIWAKLSREILRDHRQILMTNPPTQGDQLLRSAIADHLRGWRGMQVHPDQIIVGAGTDYLYGLIIQLLGFDRVYALEDPGYRKLMQVYRAMGLAAVPVPLDLQGLDVAALDASGAEVVHVTPSHHFPTGITMPAGRRYELLRWAGRQEGRFILEDDYDSEFRMATRPLPTLYSMDQGKHVIYLNTFTKTLASTIRVSYMVLPKALARRFVGEMSFYACTVPMFEQYTIGTFLARGYFEKHINRMRTANRKKRERLLRALQSWENADLLTISDAHAGLHFLINVALGEDTPRFARLLRGEGIALPALADFYFDPANHRSEVMIGDQDSAHTFLINDSSAGEEALLRAAQRMDQVIGQLRAASSG